MHVVHEQKEIKYQQLLPALLPFHLILAQLGQRVFPKALHKAVASKLSVSLLNLLILPASGTCQGKFAVHIAAHGLMHAASPIPHRSHAQQPPLHGLDLLNVAQPHSSRHRHLWSRPHRDVREWYRRGSLGYQCYT